MVVMELMLRRKPKENVICSSCDRGLSQGQKVCKCGAATRYMNFDERTRYEVEQWRASRARIAS